MNIILEGETKKKQFTKIFKSLSIFTDFVNIYFKNDQLYIQGMDANHVSLFEVILEKTWFKKYEIEEETVIGLSIPLLYRIMMFCNKQHDIMFNLVNGGDNLHIETIPVDDSIKKIFEITLIDLDQEQLRIPTVNYEADFIIESKKMKEFVDQMKIFGETINIHCSEEYIKLFAKGDDGKMEVEINFDDIEEYSIIEGGDFKAEYNAKYFVWMLEFYDTIEYVHIYLSKKYPMQIYYSLENDNYIRFYLAPQIQDYD